MKKKVTKFLTSLAKHDVSWMALKSIARAGFILNKERQKHEKKALENKIIIPAFCKTLMVLNGPFKGMKYPAMNSVGSAMYPKLLGSYESELHPIFKEFASKDYSEIIDIGCAEGYYAVGLAMHHKNSKVFAYDTSEKARKLCFDMAKLNGVSSHVEIRSKLTPELLGDFKFTNRGLIVCDCEGFEIDLFNITNLQVTKNCDLIIELHDFKNINISTNLKALFKSSHTLESIYSIDDIHKALKYEFPELTEMSLEDKKHILSESRPAIMEWLICKSKL